MTKWMGPEELARWQKARAKAKQRSKLPPRWKKHGKPRGR